MPTYMLSELRVGLFRTLPLFKYSPISCALTDGYGCNPRENISQQVTPNAHYTGRYVYTKMYKYI